MATNTEYLRLVLPGNDEFTDVWDQPVNENFRILDTFARSVGEEIATARGTAGSLSAFLATGHDSAGNNKPSSEIIYSRNSKLYGEQTLPPVSSAFDSQLYDHLEAIDFETFYGRSGLGSMRQALADRSAGFDYPDTVISGAATVDNQPNFLTAAGTEFQITAGTPELVLNVGGHRMRCRTNQNVGGATGSPGLRYLVATKPSTPNLVVDRSSAAAGAISNLAGKLQLFQDTGVNFVLAGVKPGDVLEVRSGQSEGYYLVEKTNAEDNTLTVNQLKILGLFKATSAGVNYKIQDPWSPSFSVEATHAPAKGKCIVGHATWDGSALSNAVAYAFAGKYESPWRAVDVSVGGGTFTESFNHNLGVIPKKVTVLVSQLNDDSGYVEQMSTAEVDNQLTVAITNSIALNPGSATYTDVDSPADVFSYVPPSLSGGVSGGLSGSIRNSRSVRMRMSRTTLEAKNPTPSLFYIDFGNVARTTGFIKVICER